MNMKNFLSLLMGITGICLLGLPAHAQPVVRGLTRAVGKGPEALAKSVSAASSLPSVSKGVSVAAQVARRTDALQDALHASQLLAHTFRARDLYAKKSSFTGTLFHTKYQGQPELYGVIATHALADNGVNLVLGRKFIADVYANGQWKQIPAEVVQLSAPSMLDVALVKFSPEDSQLLSGFSLATQAVKVGDRIQTLGLPRQATVYIPSRTVTEIAPLSLRAPIYGPREDRLGLCGGAVANEQDELVGIYTGSRPNGLKSTTGYATDARFLTKLVEAYHNDGQAFLPLELDGQKITDLRIDEYVYAVDFLDETLDVLGELSFYGKFSHNQVNNVLQKNPNIRYVELATAYVSWSKNNPNEIKFFTLARRLRYDLQAQRIVAEEQF